MIVLLVLVTLLVSAPSETARVKASDRADYLICISRSSGLSMSVVQAVAKGVYARLRADGFPEPKGDLHVNVVGSRIEYRMLALNEGIAKVQSESQGLTSKRSGTVIVLADGDSKSMRETLIHELVHQYVTVAEPDSIYAAAPSKVVTEGFAEGYAMHEWDGRHLRLKANKFVGRLALSAEVIMAFQYHVGEDVRTALTSRGNLQPAFAWALYEFVQTRGAAYERWKIALEKGAGLNLAFDEAAFGDPALLNKEFLHWLAAWLRTFPMIVSRGDWISSERETYTSFSSHLSILIPADPLAVEAAIDVTLTGAFNYAAVSFNYVSEAVFDSVVLFPCGRVEVNRVSRGFKTLYRGSGRPPQPGRTVRVGLRMRPEGTDVLIDGELLYTTPPPPPAERWPLPHPPMTESRIGFIAKGAGIRFKLIEPEPAALPGGVLGGVEFLPEAWRSSAAGRG